LNNISKTKTYTKKNLQVMAV